MPGDATAVNPWDAGTTDGSDGGSGLPVTNSVLTSALSARGTATDASNKIGTDPAFKQSYDTSLDISRWRLQPRFLRPPQGLKLLPLRSSRVRLLLPQWRRICNKMHLLR